ncbi:MAG: PilN domain-containing protein [Desulfobacterales bacterium]|nr:PilN domain-containing protein [Desulfobacterales bacterium]
MIRINLLPFRAAKKRENIKRQISIYVLTIVLVFGAMAYVFMDLNAELASAKDQEQRLRQELAAFEITLKKIGELEKKIKEVKKKLAVIKDLENKKTGPVHLLDEIALAVPKEKLWLTNLSESAGVLKLTGTAMDNETVALFMTNLERSEYINSVELVSAKLQHLAQQRLNVADFTLECKTYAYQDKAKLKK